MSETKLDYTEFEKACVDRGVAWLDENVPGWEKDMILPEFDIRNPCKCVFGMAFRKRAGSYASAYDLGVDLLENSTDEGYTDWYGFDHGPETTYYGLQRAWLEVLDERLGSQV